MWKKRSLAVFQLNMPSSLHFSGLPTALTILIQSNLKISSRRLTALRSDKQDTETELFKQFVFETGLQRSIC